MLIIHNYKKSSTVGDYIVLTESASKGGFKFMKPVMLRLIIVEPDLFEREGGLKGAKLSRNKKVKVIEEYFVDGRYKGDKSDFTNKLNILKQIYFHII